MKKYILLASFLSAGLFISSQAYSQNDQSDQSEQQHEEIIIRKKGDFPKNLTIRLKGDKVTAINGKDPEDIEGNIEVIRRKSIGKEERSFSFGQPNPHFGNMPRAFNFSPSNPNNALLGVLTIPGDSAMEGARIEEVEKGTPADSAGFQKGDMITKVDGTPVRSAMDLNEVIGEKDPGEVVTITYERNGQTDTKQVKLGRNDNQGRNFGMNGPMNMPFNHFRFYSPRQRPYKSPFPDQFLQIHPWMNNNTPHLGMTVQNRDDEKGVTVMDVKPSSAAQKAGFQSEDILIKLGDEEIHDINDVRKALAENKDESTVEATIIRDGKQKTLTVQFQKEQQKADL